MTNMITRLQNSRSKHQENRPLFYAIAVRSRRAGTHPFYNRHAMPVHPQGVMVIGVWAASAGPKDNNLEVRLYWDKVHGMLVQEMQNISGSKARSVARTASIEIETSDASTV